MDTISIAILSPIELEYMAVRRYLKNIQRQDREGYIFETGSFDGVHHVYKIIIRQTGSKNTDIALATDQMIRLFTPDAIFVVGIAGGVKDVKVGDVVVGTKAYGFDAGKVMDGYLAARPDSFLYDIHLLEQARFVKRQDNWETTINGWQVGHNVIFGPIASSDKVITSIESPEYQAIKAHFNDTTALEMESIGFATAAFRHREVRMMNIRGISDLLADKADSDAAGNQPLAAAQAAAFTFHLIQNLNFTGLTTNNITHNIIKEYKPLALLFQPDTVGSIRKLIGNNKIKQAIDQLLQLTNGRDEDLCQQVLSLSQQWTKLQKQETLGIISSSEASIASNKIVFGLLEIVSQLEGF